MSGGRPASDPRVAAHRILGDVESGAYADRAAERRLADLAAADRALALELAYGCVRLRARLDAELRRLVDRPLDRLDRSVLLWLRIGLYQLRELRVPDHAAVYETVERARRDAPPAVGLVNAVLRAATRSAPTEAFPDFRADPAGWLTAYGSHPEWLVRRWLERWPAERVRSLVELDNRAPDVTLRLLGEGAREEAAAAGGLEPRPPWPRSWTLRSGDPAPLLGRLPAVVQDPAASAVVDYAGPPRAPVLDVCSAPGGKAAVLAYGNPGARPYVAADVAPERLVRVVQASERLGLGLRPVVADGRHPAVREARTVLLDAPCTGTGVLRRRPDARWRMYPGRLAALVDLQRGLLDASADVVSRGGLLVYATCSLEPEENERQVEDFLERDPRFAREGPGTDTTDGGLPEGVLTPAGDLAVMPWTYGTDGAYAARLRRVA